jgi:AcrR family transcriptional regulator
LAAADVQPTRRERRRLEIRERIIEAALSLFESRGYEATTVNEIVSRADIAYGTFFNHFPTKLDLVRELSDLTLQGMFENVEEIRKQPGSFAEHLLALFEGAASHAEENEQQARELISAIIALALPETAGSDDRRIRLAFRCFLEDGLASGEVRKDVALDTLTEVVVGTWYSMFTSWVHFDDYPLRARASEAARFLASSLAPPQES